MGLFDAFGSKVKGLLGSDAFLQRLAQAQAFAHGDPATAGKIGQQILEWRAAHPRDAAATLPAMPPPAAKPMDASGELHFAGFDPRQANGTPWGQGVWTLVGHPGGIRLRPGQSLYGHSYMGGDSNQASSWRGPGLGGGEQYYA